jgi:hypothetical protein
MAFVDTQQGTDCTLALATDGKKRCLPAWSAIPTSRHLLTQGTPRYLDSNCKTEVWVTQWSHRATQIVRPSLVRVPREEERLHCSTENTYEVRRAKPLPGSVRIYKEDGANCVETPFYDTTAEFWEIGEVVAPETFVEGEEVLIPEEGPVVPRAWRMADGAVVSVGFHSRTLGTACAPSEESSPEGRACVASVSRGVSGYLDSSCKSSPVLVGPRTVCDQKPLLVVAEGSTPTYFSVGERLTEPFYEKLGPFAVCMERHSTPPPEWWALGAEVPLAELGTVKVQSAGTGRLRPREWVSPQGRDRMTVLDLQLTWEDKATGSYCFLGRTRDAGWRCISGYLSYNLQHFADASCTERLTVDTHPRFYSSRYFHEAAVRPGAQYTGRNYWRRSEYGAEACEGPFPVEAARPLYHAEIVPWTEFPEVVERVLPLAP